MTERAAATGLFWGHRDSSWLFHDSQNIKPEPQEETRWPLNVFPMPDHHADLNFHPIFFFFLRELPLIIQTFLFIGMMTACQWQDNSLQEFPSFGEQLPLSPPTAAIKHIQYTPRHACTKMLR